MTKLKESIQILQACEDIKEFNLVFGTWGNISVLLEDNNILITPSGIPYDDMREEDLVLCDMNGNVLHGNQKPSSELKMHVSIYKKRADVKAIVHTHSLYSSIASATLKEIPLLTEDLAMALGGPIKVTNYQTAGTKELADEVVEKLGSVNAVVLSNHGQTSVGSTLEDAVLSAVMCEKACMLYVKSLEISKSPRVLSEEEIYKMRDVYTTSYRKLREYKK